MLQKRQRYHTFSFISSAQISVLNLKFTEVDWKDIMPGKKGFYWQTDQKGPFVESHRSAKLFHYMLWCR
jgi:hypothetical protein